jgi:hypothetical protein
VTLPTRDCVAHVHEPRPPLAPGHSHQGRHGSSDVTNTLPIARAAASAIIESSGRFAPRRQSWSSTRPASAMISRGGLLARRLVLGQPRRRPESAQQNSRLRHWRVFTSTAGLANREALEPHIRVNHSTISRLKALHGAEV